MLLGSTAWAETHAAELRQHAAVYIAQGTILSITIVFSFFGHKRVTFQQKGGSGPDAAS